MDVFIVTYTLYLAYITPYIYSSSPSCFINITWFTLPHKEPEQMTPNEVTTDPKLAQLLDMFPEEDSKKLSKLLKVCGGDATLTVEAILSGQAANVPQGETYLRYIRVHLRIEL